MAKPPLTAESLFERISSLTTHTSFLIAYSGGLDSHVLLHLCASLLQDHSEYRFRAVYIDHGLQSVSTDWGQHCQEQAASLGIPYQTHELHLTVPAGESIEACAREARYQALARILQDDEVLLTAQHQDDQLETVLLQLFRGAGLDGLAAMPELSPFASGHQLRPLLSYKRENLESYADQHQLDHIIDPSNADNRFDRNFLRNAIIPNLKARWPSLGRTVSRSASLQAEASELLNSYIASEIQPLLDAQKSTLAVDGLKRLPALRQKAVLRYWIKQSGFKAPSEIKLSHIIDDVLYAGSEANPIVAWNDTQIRRFRHNLYIMSALKKPQTTDPLCWDLQQPLVLGDDIGTLKPEELGDLKKRLLQKKLPVTVRFRQGGETMRPQNRQCTISLKNLLQEAGVPPWERERLPLVFVGELLIYVPGVARIDKTELEKL